MSYLNTIFRAVDSSYDICNCSGPENLLKFYNFDRARWKFKTSIDQFR